MPAWHTAAFRGITQASPASLLVGLVQPSATPIIGIVPFRGAYFGVNDTLADMNPYQKRRDAVGLLSKFAQAQTAAICAAYVSYPFDTIRRRLQMQSEKVCVFVVWTPLHEV